jgi:hypothetical protein
VCAVGMTFFSGGALILKRKFSAHDSGTCAPL